MKSILLLLLGFFCYQQGMCQDTALTLKVKRKKCQLRLEFLNSAEQVRAVPDLSLRSKKEERANVLEPQFFSLNNGILVISTESLRLSPADNNIEVQDQQYPQQAGMTYADFNLSKKLKQKFQLPKAFCDQEIQKLILVHNGVVLADGTL